MINIHKTKLLLVGYFPNDAAIYAYASSFIAPLKNLGFEVETFNYRQMFQPFSNCKICSIYNKHRINKKFINKVLTFNPHIIFFIKAELLTSRSIEFIKKKINPYLINFYPDSPFAFWNGNSNKDILHSLPQYNCFLTWSQDLVPALISAGCKKVEYFPFAFDETLFSEPLTLNNKDKQTYASDICFIGTWEPEREWWLTQLCTRLPNTNLAIWGNEWEKKIQKRSPLKKVIRGPAIYGTSMRKAFVTTKIVLNFIRHQNIQAHNMRTFEVPASNAFLLTQWTQDQAEILFKEGESIDCFKTIDELVSKTTFYLHHTETREKIAHNGFLAAQQFTIKKQLEKLFSSLDI